MAGRVTTRHSVQGGSTTAKRGMIVVRGKGCKLVPGRPLSTYLAPETDWGGGKHRARARRDLDVTQSMCDGRHESLGHRRRPEPAVMLGAE
jgi:hypothetical protein